MVLSLTELRDTVRKVAYKKGWRFEIVDTTWHGAKLRMIVTVPDSTQPEKAVDLGIDTLIPPMYTESAFLEWLLWRIIQAEVHEAREFFTYEGAVVYDPHAEDSP